LLAVGKEVNNKEEKANTRLGMIETVADGTHEGYVALMLRNACVTLRE
jgi:hypothetical protein